MSIRYLTPVSTLSTPRLTHYAGAAEAACDPHEDLRSTVAALVNFHQHTLPVWTQRVAHLERRGVRPSGGAALPVADMSFLERAAARVDVYVSQVRAALAALRSGAGAAASHHSDARAFARRSCAALLDVEAAAAALRPRVARLLSAAAGASGASGHSASGPSGSSASGPYASGPYASGPLAVPFSPRRFSAASSRESPPLGRGLFGPAAFSAASSSRGSPPPPLPRASRSGLSTSARPSSYAASSIGRRSSMSHGRSTAAPSLCAVKDARRERSRRRTWEEISAEYTARCTEPFDGPEQTGRDRAQLLAVEREPFAHDGGDGGGGGRIFGLLNNEIYTRHASRSFHEHRRLTHGDDMSLGPEERRELLEQIARMERSKYVMGKDDLEKAKGFFQRLYGTRQGPRRYVEWLDDLTVRALRQR